MSMRSLSICLAAAVAAGGCSLDVGSEDAELRVAHLTGDKMLPPQEVLRDEQPSTSVVAMILDGGRISYDITIFNVDRARSATLHIGGPSESTPPVATLFTDATGFTGTGTFIRNEPLTSGDLTGGVSFQTVYDAVRSGNAYVQMATANFPDGALRGQITAP